MRWPAAIWRPACACPLRATSVPTVVHRRLLPAPALRQFQKSFASQSRAQGRPAYDFKQKKRRTRLLVLSALAGASILAFYTNKPFRHLVIAVKRCSLVVLAVSLDVIDYKLLFRQTWQYEEELESERGLAARQTRHDAYRACHKRCAERILVVLKKNGGIYVKLGQHISSVQLLPLEWTSTMRPLQDQCFPTEFEDVENLFKLEVGQSTDQLFSDFARAPLGVASLAQVHAAVDRNTGRKVAVKVMHPDLEDFAEIDINTTLYMLRAVKALFPSFAFEWLGEEMQENLPLEMDFRHEAQNAERCRANFSGLKSTPLIIPEVLYATKRVLVMEFIEGGRVDNLEYLKEHNINRNQVSQELSRIFSRMVYEHGFFHADPHAGNLLIRPTVQPSRSPFNFEIALLDHGLYFDLTDDLRVNYARFWLSLLAPPTSKTEAARRHYAKVLAGIDDELYLIFQSAITGRASFNEVSPSLMDMAPADSKELRRLRQAVTAEGIMQSIFGLLRQLPKRLLMVLKLNDLTRWVHSRFLFNLTRYGPSSLDHALQTTHGPAVWLIIARFCAQAAWVDDLRQLKHRYASRGLSLSLIGDWIQRFFAFQSWKIALASVESAARFRGFLVSLVTH